MNSKNNYLFLDLDECMVHSLYANNETHADQLIDTYGEHWVGKKFNIRHDGWYVTFRRSWTKDLLTFARQLLGNENVMMLSTGTLDYIRWVNVHAELGFDPNTNIFGREDLKRQFHCHPKFKDTFNVLVDNETYDYHNFGIGTISKVAFLNDIPESQFIHVKKFEVWIEPISDQTEYLESVKDKIMTAFNL